MSPQHALAAVCIACVALTSHAGTATPAQSTTGATCETVQRLATIQDGSRKLAGGSSELNIAASSGAKSEVAPAWAERLQSEARTLNAAAERLASAPANADPESAFNLGKHMNGVQQLLADPSIESARNQNAALDSLARLSGSLAKDVSLFLANVSNLKAEAGRCGQR